MKTRPYMKFFPEGWLVGCRRHTLEEVGLYIELVSLCWIDGSVPRDPVQMSRKLGRDPRKVRRIFPGIEDHFVSLSAAEITNKRVQAELDDFQSAPYNKKKKKKKEEDVKEASMLNSRVVRSQRGAPRADRDLSSIADLLSKVADKGAP